MIKKSGRRGEAERREAILEAAIAVFGEHGLGAATTRQVGGACGVNSALIYYYFEDKHTLYVEALRRVLSGFLAFLQQRPQPRTGGRAPVVFLVNGVLDYWSEHPDRMRLISMALVTHPELLAEVINALLQDGPPLPLRLLAEGAARGELRPGNPLQAWWSILGLCLFTLHSQDVVDRIDPRIAPVRLPGPEERRRFIVELLVNALVAKGA